MFQVKVNIYKLIKMLAKIKYDEDHFKRPLDLNSSWYKLSRTKVDYRQIALDKMKRERPILVEALDNPSYYPDFSSPSRSNISWEYTQEDVNSINGEFGDGPLVFNYPDINSPYSNGYLRNMNRAYERLLGPAFQAYYREIITNPNKVYQEDTLYMYSYSTYNFWWLDLCIMPLHELIPTYEIVGISYDPNKVKDESWTGYDQLTEYLSYIKHSPSRDLTTNTLLHFASMQDNSQAFIKKMSYVTAPYMPTVEQRRIYMPPITNCYATIPLEKLKLWSSAKAYSDTLNQVHPDYWSLATIYGIGQHPEIFEDKAPSSLDRKNRQKMFNDFFNALDNADWYQADLLADSLIQLRDSTGWSPYIGFGDLSLFIRRMNIPSEYIMTHALTDFQDEVLTHAYAVNHLNNRKIDTATTIESTLGGDRGKISVDNRIATTDGYVTNVYPEARRQDILDKAFAIKNAVGKHTLMNGSSTDAQKILANSNSFFDTIDALEAEGTGMFIDRQLELLDKMKG